MHRIAFYRIPKEEDIAGIAARSEVSKEIVQRVLNEAKAYYSEEDKSDETGNRGPGRR